MALDRGRLLAIFGEELEDRRRDLERGLLELEGHPSAGRAGEVVAELFRAAHSLKGAAHSAGIAAVAHVAHDLEDLFAQLRDSGDAPGGAQLHAALQAIDQLDSLAQELRPPGGSEASSETSARVGRGDETQQPARPAPGPARGEQLRARVASEDLDAAVAAAGELHLSVARVTELSDVARDTAAEARRVERDWQGLSGWLTGEANQAQLRAAAGRVDAGLRQLATLATDMQRRAAERERHLNRAAGEVQHAVQQLGLVRFDEICVGLDRAVRDVAKRSDKQVALEVDAGTLELDRGVAAVLRDPLLHLVRNAVDHGIEPPEARVRAGKPAGGRVAIAAALHEGELVVTVSDDGAGPDVAAIRAAAVRRGLDASGTDDEVVQLLFHPGFSTGSATTEISGRGVGLDVVRTSVETVGGSVEIKADAGTGMAVRMRLPLTLSIMRAVVVTTAGEVIALPAAAVEGAWRIPRDAVTDVGGRPTVVVDGRSVALAHLATVLGFGHGTVAGDAQLLVVGLRTADADAALIVDAVLGEQEVWVRPLPSRLRGLRGLLGGVVLGDGRCALLLSPATWVRAVRQRASQEALPSPPISPPAARILLAEDTATTRMLEQSILEAAGYEVVVAVDGAEAWRLLQQQGADLVVTDVDMPNLDGFELCMRIRSSPRFAALPVVLVTALADDRDRARGLQVGADAYFVKSSFDQTSVLDTIARLL
ncbi:MAG: response regulator [Actinobacteria bacterium]|nr:response regulator [Actinomycetota bacterium]